MLFSVIIIGLIALAGWTGQNGKDKIIFDTDE